jgi:hypothetical protein
MYIQFLVEGESDEILINNVMKKYKEERPEITITHNIKSYKGLGGFKKGRNSALIKSEHLLNNLKKSINAYNNGLRYMPNSAVFIIVDNDKRNMNNFQKQLEEIVSDNKNTLDKVFCIAVEESEAWLLGDILAIQNAYPKNKDRIATKHQQYKQDDILEPGTWEFLFDMLNPQKGRKNKFTYPVFPESGIYKCEWAEKIGNCLNIRNNKSNSFNYFLSELDKRRDDKILNSK